MRVMLARPVWKLDPTSKEQAAFFFLFECFRENVWGVIFPARPFSDDDGLF